MGSNTVETIIGAIVVANRASQEGARTSVHLATSPDVESVGGLYFVRCRAHRPLTLDRA